MIKHENIIKVKNNNTNEMSDVMITKLERSEWFVTY